MKMPKHNHLFWVKRCAYASLTVAKCSWNMIIIIIEHSWCELEKVQYIDSPNNVLSYMHNKFAFTAFQWDEMRCGLDSQDATSVFWTYYELVTQLKMFVRAFHLHKCWSIQNVYFPCLARLVVSFLFFFCFIFILFMCFEKIAPVMSENESDADILLHEGGEMYLYCIHITTNSSVCKIMHVILQAISIVQSKTY